MNKGQNRVLVLNKAYTAVGIATVQRAFGLLMSTYNDNTPKARIVDTDYQVYTWSDWAEMRPMRYIFVLKDGRELYCNYHLQNGIYTLSTRTENIIIPESDVKEHHTNIIYSANSEFQLPNVILLSRYEKLPQQRVHFSRRTIYRRDNFTCSYCGCKPGTEELSLDHIVPKSKGGLTSWTNVTLCCRKCNSRKADKLPEEVGFKRPHPTKPKFNLLRGDKVNVRKSWCDFLSEAYWSTELQNDMK